MSTAQKTLTNGAIKRGDTVSAWEFDLAGVPSPGDAVVKFGVWIEDLGTEPVFELISPTDFALTVAAGVISGEVPSWNAPSVGNLLWELEVVSDTAVGWPTDGVWTKTFYQGTIVCIEDGAPTVP